jgi:hypothetical protein
MPTRKLQESVMSLRNWSAASCAAFALGVLRSAAGSDKDAGSHRMPGIPFGPVPARINAHWLAAGACVAAFLLTLGLRSLVTANTPLFFLAAVAVSAAVGGKAPARVAIAMSVVSAAFFYFHPRYAVLPVETELLRLAVFVAVALFVLGLSLRLHDGRAKAERDLSAIVWAMSDVVFVVDREGRIVRVTETGAPLRYREVSKMIGRSLDDVVSRDDAARCHQCIRRALAERRTVHVDYQLVLDSSPAWFAAAVSPLTDTEVVWVARDITTRRQAEDNLRLSEARHRLFFEQNPLPMWVFDESTRRVVAVNEAAVESYGFPPEEFVGLSVDVFASDCASANGRANQRHRCPAVCEHRRRDGTVMDVEVRSFALEFDGRPARLVAALDVTERLRLETRLRHAQRLEAVGQLAGGISHDFNNVLTAITNYAGALLHEIPPGDSRREDVGEILKAAARAGSLTKQLLTFSRRQVLRPQVFSPNTLIGDLDNMLRRVIPERVRLVTVLGADVGHVSVDAGQLEQVLLNLVVNARDAMPQGGTVSVTTSNVDLDQPYPAPHTVVQPGRYVALEVNDTGVGMDADTQARIFEPFFTTKAPGMGTGLGLSTVYGIVKQSAGYIWCWSELGRGTTFTVYLPRVESAVGGATRTRAAREVIAPAGLAPSAGVGVLVVDDDRAVRVATARALTLVGYSVFEAASADEALALCERHGVGDPTSSAQAIALVVTDIVMPEIGGRELAARLRDRYPRLPILFMSGYSEDAAPRRELLPSTARFIQKPFSLDVFVQTVDGAVSEARASQPASMSLR